MQKKKVTTHTAQDSKYIFLILYKCKQMFE